MKYVGFIWRVLRRLIWETATDQTTGLSYTTNGGADGFAVSNYAFNYLCFGK